MDGYTERIKRDKEAIALLNTRLQERTQGLLMKAAEYLTRARAAESELKRKQSNGIVCKKAGG